LSTVDLTDPERAGAGFEWLREPGPSLTDGRRTRWVYGPGFDVDRGLAFQLSAEQAVFAGGRTVEDKVLVAALDALNEIPTASTSPGSVIGVIPGFESTRVSAAYDGDRRGVYVTIEAASPSVQAAYRAVAHPDPERTVDPMTESSC